MVQKIIKAGKLKFVMEGIGFDIATSALFRRFLARVSSMYRVEDWLRVERCTFPEYMDWRSVDISYVNLTGTKLVGTNLTYADMTGADMTDVDFTNTNLTGVIFMKTILKRALLKDVRQVDKVYFRYVV